VAYSLHIETIRPPFSKEIPDRRMQNSFIAVDRNALANSPCADCPSLTKDCLDSLKQADAGE
jgi:hypothetical protein